MSEFKKKMFEKYRFAAAKFVGGVKPKGREEEAIARLKEKIDRCVANLKEPYNSIFVKTHLENNRRFWWDSIYPSCTYYRYLKEAQQQFFSIFY